MSYECVGETQNTKHVVVFVFRITQIHVITLDYIFEAGLFLFVSNFAPPCITIMVVHAHIPFKYKILIVHPNQPTTSLSAITRVRSTFFEQNDHLHSSTASHKVKGNKVEK